MISITCTNCHADLTIDDAFAGGVCRCQHCGTIQTVPARSKVAAAQPVPKPAAAAQTKTLYQNKARVRQANATGTGLDDLANAVASSGLGSGLSNQRQTAKQGAVVAPSPPAKRNLVPVILALCGVVILVLAIVVIVLLTRGHPTPGPGEVTPPTSDGGSSTATVTGANFCGVPLHSPATIFLVDRGNSISNDFDTVKAAVFKSIEGLGPSRKFQVILWDNDSGSAEFPAGQLRDATAGAVTDLRNYFQDTVAAGSSHVSGPLKEAVSRNPTEIIIVTGKGTYDLDDDDSAVLRSMIGKNIRIDVVQIYPTSPAPNAVLQEVARATGGQFKTVSAAELRELAR